MQDTEFTIEEGRLYMLQTRNAKRPAQAAVRFACDAVDEGLLSEAEALATLDPVALDALLHPTFDPSVDYEVIARGVAASPGAAQGAIVVHRPRRGARRPRRARGRARAPVHRGRRRRRLPRRRAGSSPPRAARPRTRRSSRAAWAARASSAPASSRSTSDAREMRVGGRVHPRGRPPRDRRHDRGDHDRRRARSSRRR